MVQANACSPIRVKHDDGKAQELRRQAKGIGNGTIHHLNTTDLSFLERKPSFYLPGAKDHWTWSPDSTTSHVTM